MNVSRMDRIATRVIIGLLAFAALCGVAFVTMLACWFASGAHGISW